MVGVRGQPCVINLQWGRYLCKAISRCVHCWLLAIFTLEGMKKGKCPKPFWPGLHKFKGIMFHKFETSAKMLNCIKLQRKHFMLHTFAGQRKVYCTHVDMQKVSVIHYSNVKNRKLLCKELPTAMLNL